MKMFLEMAFIIMLSSANAMEPQDTYISETAQEACIEYGEYYNICPELLMAIVEKESCGQPEVENGGCYGLMQISDKWHSGRMDKLGVTDLYNERQNILVGADYLSELFAEYHDIEVVLMIYNGEQNAIEKAKSGEISSYARDVMERSMELEILHGK